MSYISRFFAAALLSGTASLWAAPLSAQDRPWSVSFDAGSQLALSGDVHTAEGREPS